jgi:hypothetical protein
MIQFHEAPVLPGNEESRKPVLLTQVAKNGSSPSLQYSLTCTLRYFQQ